MTIHVDWTAPAEPGQLVEPRDPCARARLRALLELESLAVDASLEPAPFVVLPFERGDRKPGTPPFPT